MKVIAYTHSGHGPSVAYGLACLFLIGFLWGAMGGAGTALSAFLDRKRLTDLVVVALAVLAGWWVQDRFFDVYFNGLHVFGTQWYDGLRDQLRAGTITAERYKELTGWIDWHDTDWIGVVVAAAAVLLLAAVRRKVSYGTSLALHLCAGWWLGFTVLTVGLGLRMTPPRGDNWSVRWA